MQIFTSIQTLQIHIQSWRAGKQSIAFVPTMGGLHQGHLSLVELAKGKADKVVVSIFVNPAQFSENEDFDSYPRTLDSDLSALALKGVDAVFTPSIDEIYPNGIDKNFEIGEIGQILCGKTRPHFFNGVVQVVRRLFEIVRPDVAVFGQKDYQQLKIIEKFTSGVEIIAGKILREPDGLALSTRNHYLSTDERKIAPKFYLALLQAKQCYLRAESVDSIKQQLQNTLNKHFKVDYLEILDANTLKQITDNNGKIVILSAVFLAKNRLIDNIIF